MTQEEHPKQQQQPEPETIKKADEQVASVVEETTGANLKAEALQVAAPQRHEPKSFKVGRLFELERGRRELALFDTLSTLDEDKEEGLLTLKLLGRNVSMTTIQGLNFALANVLSNQSYQYGHEKLNTGITDGKTRLDGVELPSIPVEGKRYYHGTISIKLSELAAKTFGTREANGRQRQEVAATLRLMQNTYISNSRGQKFQFLNVYAVTKDPSTGADVYHITLHPLYAMEVQRNFGEHPQDAMRLLREKTGKATPAKLTLYSLLSIQDKRKPYRIYATDLIAKLGMEQEARKQGSKRTTAKLYKLFEAMAKVGMTTGLPEEDSNNERGEIKFTFHLNPNYIPKE